MTESLRQPVQVGEEVYFAPVGSRHLVQGAPTSPGVANAIAMSLDRRLAGLGRKLGFTYTRYADDLTFSGNDVATARGLIKSVQRIVHAEGFALNPDKTRIMTQRGAQLVTGVTVNRELGLSRRLRRKLRAALHQAGAGPASAPARRKLDGKLAYVSMLNVRQAAALRGSSDQEHQAVR
jgi:retron-type reverse transcriptase